MGSTAHPVNVRNGSLPDIRSDVRKGWNADIDRAHAAARLSYMKSIRLGVMIVCFGFPSVGAGQSNNAADPHPPSMRYLSDWSACQRDFVMPRLQTSDPIPYVVQEAHARCAESEQSLKQALNKEHGPERGTSIFASIKEATDRIMCGLLTSTRMPGDSKISFNSAADCLAGNIRVAR